MLAVHLENGLVEVRKRARPRAREGCSLVRVLAAGICNTDIELVRGYYGFRGCPGHEFVGEVVESSSASLRGKRVVGEINLNCGSCDWCRRGLGRHCPRRTVLGIVKHPGAFAEFLTLPDANLHPVPNQVSTEHAVFTEPIAAACEILDQAPAIARGRVAVLGDGKLGLLIAQVLHARGSEVCLYGRHANKLAIAKRAGIDTQMAAAKLPEAEFPYVVDATGSAEGLRAAVEMVRPRGTIVMKSTVHGEVGWNTAPVIVNEITLVGSRCGRFEPALKLLRSGKLHLDAMLAAEFPLSEAGKAFQRAEERGALKVLLRPGA
ncbi:MAG: zinc-binding dehydrogenase [Acidimicrobiia bacterium]|nr:zinc-binding dehydrogenase [Acidimicrobiia bacterium]